ncbi:10149_t:CDS:2 [Acaulospora morrowiae]|uniref:10149_t:CDS:1 n=1 Tax=Acaulospora morrowiae TaxID=94023 RepID=A0A9N9AB65_9GLOM|nr:10149_t:CDS:2 [Acaulospora morrowiae]
MSATLLLPSRVFLLTRPSLKRTHMWIRSYSRKTDSILDVFRIRIDLIDVNHIPNASNLNTKILNFQSDVHEAILKFQCDVAEERFNLLEKKEGEKLDLLKRKEAEKLNMLECMKEEKSRLWKEKESEKVKIQQEKDVEVMNLKMEITKLKVLMAAHGVKDLA